MKLTISKKRIATLLGLGAFLITLLSFTKKAGGEGYEIYLDNKLVIQQFGNQQGVKSLQLDATAANSLLTIKYWHCGQLGKGRQLTIKDAQNKTLKQWNYGDAKSNNVAMNCKVKDIITLEKGKNITLQLYYSSSELPKGKLLASLRVSNNSVASLSSR